MLDNKNPNEFNDIYSGNAENTPESNTDIPQKNAEASYEWNSDKSDNKSDSTEYHYSYVNGNNKDASHNPNRYNEPTQYSSQNTRSGYSNNYHNQNTTAYDNKTIIIGNAPAASRPVTGASAGRRTLH